MSDYTISSLYPGDRRTLGEIQKLLTGEGIRLDKNLDYTCYMADEDGNPIATGSCFRNTLRCMAVRSDHRGEALLNEIVSHLVQVEYERGNLHLFLYTKPSSAKFFETLGFCEIARVPDVLVFMENSRNGFENYIRRLKRETAEAAGETQDAAVLAERAQDAAVLAEAAPRTGAIVMNANPFTLGHRYLIEMARASCSFLHLFLVSEDLSLVPFPVRKRLLQEGTRDIPGLVLHESGSYMISSATFPSYFLRDEDEAAAGHARRDLAVFSRIAGELGIGARFVGEEPFSRTTALYNRIMKEELPREGISCLEIPRKAVNGEFISASEVRRRIHAGDLAGIRDLVPETTYAYFTSDEAAPVIERIRKADRVIHD